MGQPSAPPPPILSPPPPPPSLPSLPVIQAGANNAGCQVRCTVCKMILTVGAGLTEFACPNCNLPQMHPPALFPTPQQQQRNAAAHGVGPTEIQLPCAHCKAILNVPHGFSRFNCPQCGVDLAVDLSKTRQLLPPPLTRTGAPLFPVPPLPEEANEVNLTKNAAYKEARVRDLKTQLVRSQASCTHICQVNLAKNAAYKEARVRDLETQLVRSQASRTHICQNAGYKEAGVSDLQTQLVRSQVSRSRIFQVNLTKNAAYKEARVRDSETQLVRSQASVPRICQINLTKNAAYKEARVRDLEKIKRKGKEIPKRHNSRDNDVIKIKADDYIGLQNDLMELGAEIYATSELVEKRWNESSSSLKWNKDRVRELESKLASLEQELLSGKDVAATIERQFSSEISRLTELVEQYKESSEKWSKKARELEGSVTALKTHLVQIEDDYKQRLENEALARKENEKEADRWKEKFEKCAAELESFNMKDNMLQETLKKAQEKARVQVNNLEEELGKSREGGIEEGGKKGKNALPRKKVIWSEEEVQALTAGVEKYGTGCWKQILNDVEFASSLQNRSNIDLKDKWRNISKTSS